MRLYIENNYTFVKMVELAILFAGVVQYYCHVVLGGVETFSKNAQISC